MIKISETDMVDIDRIPGVADLAVHKRKVLEVSSWLKDFSQHKKVLSESLLPSLASCFGDVSVLPCDLVDLETACIEWTGGEWEEHYCVKFCEGDGSAGC
jgi:hypothetical protein